MLIQAPGRKIPTLYYTCKLLRCGTAYMCQSVTQYPPCHNKCNRLSTRSRLNFTLLPAWHVENMAVKFAERSKWQNLSRGETAEKQPCQLANSPCPLPSVLPPALHSRYQGLSRCSKYYTDTASNMITIITHINHKRTHKWPGLSPSGTETTGETVICGEALPGESLT